MRLYATVSKRWLALLSVSLLGIGIACAPLSAADEEVAAEQVEEALSGTRVVGDIAVPDGMHRVKVEGIGLVVNLNGTGSNPPISPQRAAMLDDMKKRGVRTPNYWLESKNTAIVLVRAYLRPGVQKGDRIDVEVQIPRAAKRRACVTAGCWRPGCMKSPCSATRSARAIRWCWPTAP
ncbi:MAG: flagellar basal body P-ring protein FlgI [Pirellulales bacterium]